MTHAEFRKLHPAVGSGSTARCRTPPKPDAMSTSGPSHVDVTYILVVPEQKRVTGINITDAIPAINNEGRRAPR